MNGCEKGNMKRIKVKTKFLLPDYTATKEETNGCYNGYVTHYALVFGIRADTFDSRKSCLIADIRWANDTERTSKQFEDTKEGFEKACLWLDEQRVQFAEQLL